MRGAFSQRLRRRGVFGSIVAPLRYQWLRAVRTSEGARYVAGGFAVGVFWGCVPIFIAHLPFAVVSAYLFRCSRPAATAGVFLSNPFTIPPHYSLCWVLGHAVTASGKASSLSVFTDGGDVRAWMMSLGWADLGAMILGGLILGAVLCVPAYFLAFRMAQGYVDRRRARRAAVDGKLQGSGD